MGAGAKAEGDRLQPDRIAGLGHRPVVSPFAARPFQQLVQHAALHDVVVEQVPIEERRGYGDGREGHDETGDGEGVAQRVVLHEQPANLGNIRRPMHTLVLAEDDGRHEGDTVCEKVQRQAVECCCEGGAPSLQTLSTADRVVQEEGHGLRQDRQPACIEDDGQAAPPRWRQALDNRDGHEQAEVGDEPAPAQHRRDRPAASPDPLQSDVEVHVVVNDPDHLQHAVGNEEKQQRPNLRYDDLTYGLPRAPRPPAEEGRQHQSPQHEGPKERHERAEAGRCLERQNDEVFITTRADGRIRGEPEERQEDQ
mmetsp:Transcript_37210/g.95159  ORF Transcript_37210/g.95159 Transcript_37210/m.95159 type:complete len:309 (+) Transcript_37210:712-1638(+)